MSMTQQRYAELRQRILSPVAGDEATDAEMAEFLTLDERLKEQAAIRAAAQQRYEHSLRGVERIAYALRRPREP
jgi:hypothetical protein